MKKVNNFQTAKQIFSLGVFLSFYLIFFVIFSLALLVKVSLLNKSCSLTKKFCANFILEKSEKN